MNQLALILNLGVVCSLSAQAPVQVDVSREKPGVEPIAFTPVVGHWVIAKDGEKPCLMVDGRRWRSGQASAGLADKARALYGARYAEFLDGVTAYAYYPYAVAKGVEDFRDGEIRFRFKALEGRVDQGAGILFDLKPNGDYLSLRANALENNLVLWRVVKGKRSSVKWVRNTPTATRQWHDLRLVVHGRQVQGYLDGRLYLEHTLPNAVSGKVGVWSKSDSVVLFDAFTVTAAK